MRGISGVQLPTMSSQPQAASAHLDEEEGSSPGERRHSGGEEAEAAVRASEVIAAMYRAGAVIEQPCPDFCAHGVAVSLHRFT